MRRRSALRHRYGRARSLLGAIDRERTQNQMFQHAHDRSAAGNTVMMDLLYGPNPITDDELRKLIAKRPEVYARFAGYLGKRGK
jgi:hypothetical protein